MKMQAMTGMLLSSALVLSSFGALTQNADAQRKRGYYDRKGHYHRTHSGIGPGKGALIGGGGGAVIGALAGGPTGALVGGAIGAGGGALVGKAVAHRRHNREREAGVR